MRNQQQMHCLTSELRKEGSEASLMTMLGSFAAETGAFLIYSSNACNFRISGRFAQHCWNYYPPFARISRSAENPREIASRSGRRIIFARIMPVTTVPRVANVNFSLAFMPNDATFVSNTAYFSLLRQFLFTVGNVSARSDTIQHRCTCIASNLLRHVPVPAR